MSESLERLEQEVRASRERLARDLNRLRGDGKALNAKDALVHKANSQFQSAVGSVIEDLKARAAANPGAMLAIGAGIAWRLIQRPPVATALIGAGLYSLSRTTPRRGGSARAGSLPQLDVKHRLATVKDQAVELAGAATERAAEAAGAATATLQDAAARFTNAAIEFGRSEVVQDAVHDTELRDKLLLGAAGVAVTAAVGIAVQRRMKETV